MPLSRSHLVHGLRLQTSGLNCVCESNHTDSSHELIDFSVHPCSLLSQAHHLTPYAYTHYPRQDQVLLAFVHRRTHKELDLLTRPFTRLHESNHATLHRYIRHLEWSICQAYVFYLRPSHEGADLHCACLTGAVHPTHSGMLSDELAEPNQRSSVLCIGIEPT